jgi:hypothetical protein
MPDIKIKHLAFVTDLGNFDDLLFLAVVVFLIASKMNDGETFSTFVVCSGYQASSDEYEWFKQLAFGVASLFPRINFDFHVVKVEEAALPKKKRYPHDCEAYELMRAHWGLHKYDHVPQNMSWITPELAFKGHKPKYVLHRTCPLFINAPISLSWFTGPERWIDAGFAEIIVGFGYNFDRFLPCDADEYEDEKDRTKPEKMADISKLKGACDRLSGWNGYLSAGLPKALSENLSAVVDQPKKIIKNIGKVPESNVPPDAKHIHRWGQGVSRAFAYEQCEEALENARAAGGEGWTLGGLFPPGCKPFEVLQSMTDKNQAIDATNKLFAASYAHSKNRYHAPGSNAPNAVISFLTDPEVEFSDPIGFMLWWLARQTDSDLDKKPAKIVYCCYVDGRLTPEKDIAKDDKKVYTEISAYVARDALLVQQTVFNTLVQLEKAFLAYKQ